MGIVSQHILVVDDDPEVRDLVAVALKAHGFRVTAVADGHTMVAANQNGRFDLVVFDLNLPDEIGLVLCRRLKEEPDTFKTPVIMSKAAAEKTDRIVVLEMGAGHCVSKPFNSRELVARVRSVLRRVRVAALRPSTSESQLLEFVDWRLDSAKRQLIGAEGSQIVLTSGEFELLLALVLRPDRILSRDQILAMTKGDEVASFDRSVDVQLSRLPIKIKRNPKKRCH